MILAVNLVFLLFVIAFAVAALYVNKLISSVLILGCYSFFLALLWTTMGAVDVAFTEAVVGAGASTIFFLLALFYTSHHAVSPQKMPGQRWGLVIVLILGCLFAYGALDLPSWGNPNSPASTHISPEYIRRSLEDTHTPNVVTSILADYRGFDTLMETAVIFTAGLSCLLIMGFKRH